MATAEHNSGTDEQVRIPCVDLGLSAILTRNGEFQWTFKETLPVRLFGEENARRIWGATSSVFASVISFLLLVAWLVVSALNVFKNEVSHIIPSGVFLFAQALAAVGILFYLSFTLDVRIVWIAIRNYQVIANVSLSIIIGIGLAAMWNFDERAIVGVNIILITIFISITDALPPDLRNLIGLPVLIFLEIVLFVGAVTVVMNRFPLDVKPEVNLGTLDNAAVTNVTLSVYQMTIDSAFALVFFLGKLIYHSIVDRKLGFLQATFAPIRVEFQRDDALKSFFQLQDLIRAFLQCVKRTDNRAISQHVLGSDVRSVVMIPVQEDEIVQILNENKLFQWKFEHTLGYRLFGPISKKFIYLFLGGEYGLYKLIGMLSIAFFCALVVVGYSLHILVVNELFIACCVPLYLIDVTVFVCLFDFRVIRMLFKSVYYWAQIIVSILISVSLSSMYNFDIRVMVIPLYVGLITLIASIDAFHTTFRMIFAVPVAIIIIGGFAVVFVLLFLGRLPDQSATTLYFGTFGGLATRDVTLNLTQFVLDLAVGQFVLLVTILYYSIRYPNELIFIKAKITGVDDPTFIHFEFLGSLLTAHRRVSQMHLEQIATLQQQNVRESDNPEFDGSSTSGNNDRNGESVATNGGERIAKIDI